jgi:hypothetical protein
MRSHLDRSDISPAEIALLADLLQAAVSSGKALSLTLGADASYIRLDTTDGVFAERIELGDYGSEEALHRLLFHLRKIKRAA